MSRVLLLLALGGCSTSVTPVGLGEGCPGAGALEPLSTPPAFAVVLSDYTSTAIAMLDSQGKPIDTEWLTSGTAEPGLVAALSGDVVLPSVLPDGSLLVIDRFRTDVVSRFCTPDGSIVGQVRTHEDGQGFSSNPQDVVVDGTRAWVSRYGRNPNSAGTDRGNDLLEIDLNAMTRTGRTIDLSQFDSMAPDAQGQPQAIYARPSKLVGLERFIVVGLDRLGAAFDAAADGRLAVIDRQTHAVRSVELAGLRNCGTILKLPEPNRVLVACFGFAFDVCDESARRTSAGLAIVDADTASVDALWQPSAQQALAVFEPAVLPDGTVVATAAGSCDGAQVDRWLVTDVNTSTQQLIYEGSTSFTLGRPALWDDLVLLPDANTGVVAFRWSQDGLEEQDVVLPLSQVRLPPRQIRALQ